MNGDGMTERLGSFSFDVAKRILDVLHENGKLKRTNLATKTGLNYDTCLRYSRMLAFLGWLDVKDDITITELGRRVRTRLLDSGSISNLQDNQQVIDMLSKHEKSQASYPIEEVQNTLKDSRSIDASKDKPNIMVVDDDKEVALTFESFLSSEGYIVEAFTESYSALSAFALNPFKHKLVILDIRMPEMNGIQLFQSLKAMNPACKVIFISSLDAAQELVSTLQGVTAQHIIKKPVDKKPFLKIVRTILGK
jgi:CheY-like chemotaxis protein/predicted transcriptional regulator